MGRDLGGKFGSEMRHSVGKLTGGARAARAGYSTSLCKEYQNCSAKRLLSTSLGGCEPSRNWAVLQHCCLSGG